VKAVLANRSDLLVCISATATDSKIDNRADEFAHRRGLARIFTLTYLFLFRLLLLSPYEASFVNISAIDFSR
jgi:hypothetical protein